jgi:hypothetical protein
LAVGVFIVTILLKDYYNYGDLSWSIFGIRPVLILFSFPVMGNIFYNRKHDYKNALVIAVKTIIIFLVPVTLFQLKELPPLFGATFIGPRTMGFWPNPIIYSICLAAFALFLWVVQARNAFFWIMICFALAISTGGRAGLLALSLLVMMYLVNLSGIRRLEVRSRLALYFFITCIIAVMIPILFVGLSSTSISGRVDTEGKAFNDGRISIIKDVFEEISSDEYISIFFGHRLGEGTNAVNTITSNTQISDNLFVMILRSYGSIGLILFITLVLLWVSRSYSNPHSIMIILVSLPMITSQSIIEIHPAGLLLVICASIAMQESKGKYQNQKKYTKITKKFKFAN